MGKKQSKSNPAVASSSQPTTASDRVLWPSISPKEGLNFEVVLEDQIVLLHGFLDGAECKRFCAFLEEQPLVVTPSAKRGEADRVNDRVSITSTDFATTLWAALEPYVRDIASFQTHLKPPATPTGFNDNIRLYRYGPGQYFGRHYDDSIRNLKDQTWSEWTLLVYLTGEEDGVEGGQTVFYQPRSRKVMDEFVVPLTRGTALLHRHGKECLLHEGREVVKGKKLVLRSDLMFKQ